MKIPAYLDYIRKQPCIVCRRTPSDPHHCGKHGTAKRNHDEDVVPLCREHHRLLHDGKIKIPDILEKSKNLFEGWQNAHSKI